MRPASFEHPRPARIGFDRGVAGSCSVAQAFAFHPRLGVIERPFEAVEERADLGLGDHEGRAERDRVADIAHDQPVLLAAFQTIGAHLARRREGPSGALVGDHLTASDQPHAASFTDECVIGKRRKPRLEVTRGEARAWKVTVWSTVALLAINLPLIPVQGVALSPFLLVNLVVLMVTRRRFALSTAMAGNTVAAVSVK